MSSNTERPAGAFVHEEYFSPTTPGTLHVAIWPTGSRKLTPGVLDEDAKVVFSQGQCHAMAMELAERLDKPIFVMLTCEAGEDGPDQGDELPWLAQHWTHAVVEIGPNRYLDVDGVFEEHEIVTHYCRLGEEGLEYELAPVAASDLALFHTFGAGLRPDREAACQFVDAVLREYKDDIEIPA